MLDATAFYASTPFLSSGKYYTTNAVFNEIKHIKKSISAVEALVDSGKLAILDPDKSQLQAVSEAAKKTGDYQKLSAEDLTVIALSRQMGIALITDDMAAANVAASIGISVESVSKQLKHVRKWVSYCSACGVGYGPNAKECDRCGNKLKRRFKLA